MPKRRPNPDYYNKAHVLSLSTPAPAFCAVCRRRAGPCGHGSLKTATLWACRYDDCGPGFPRIREMSTPDFDELEQEALIQAAKAGLAYLRTLGTTDLAKLEGAQALEFLELVIDGFGCHLRHKLCPEAPMGGAESGNA